MMTFDQACEQTTSKDYLFYKALLDLKNKGVASVANTEVYDKLKAISDIGIGIFAEKKGSQYGR